MRDIDIPNLSAFLKETEGVSMKFSSCPRIVLPDGKLTAEAFLASLKIPFEVIAVPAGFVCQPMEKHSMTMYMDGQWFILNMWEELYRTKKVPNQLDAVIFNKHILNTIFNITCLLEDERLLLMDDSFSVNELISITDQMKGVLFLLYPISRAEIEECVKEEVTIPPMSFCVEMLA